jgi:hypothetical protein
MDALRTRQMSACCEQRLPSWGDKSGSDALTKHPLAFPRRKAHPSSRHPGDRNGSRVIAQLVRASGRVDSALVAKLL